MLPKNEIERPQAIGARHCPFGQDPGDWANVSCQQFGCMTDCVWGNLSCAWSSRWLPCALPYRNFFHWLDLCHNIKEFIPSNKEGLTIFLRRKRRGEKSEQLFLIFRFRRGPLNNDARHGTEKSGEIPFDGPKGLMLFLFPSEIDP